MDTQAIAVENSTFPWNDMIELTDGATRGLGIALGAVHEQLCVVADLLRPLLDEQAALDKKVNRMAQAVGS